MPGIHANLLKNFKNTILQVHLIWNKTLSYLILQLSSAENALTVFFLSEERCTTELLLSTKSNIQLISHTFHDPSSYFITYVHNGT